eukprot:3132402-Rhodomonas_salina.1
MGMLMLMLMLCAVAAKATFVHVSPSLWQQRVPLVSSSQHRGKPYCGYPRSLARGETSSRACWENGCGCRRGSSGTESRRCELTAPYAMSSTGIAYAATRCPVLVQCMLLRDVRYWYSVCCYTMSGTGIAYDATSLLGNVRY